MFQAIGNIADEELEAMRKVCATWSKNSVLVPFKNKDGKFSYVDFSHLNAYDTLTRPIQTVLMQLILVEQIKMVSWMILFLDLLNLQKK